MHIKGWIQALSAKQRSLSFILLFLCILALLKILWIFIADVTFLARGAIDDDTTIYFIVGRGILNGLQPYVDLFESKPPGIFLLSAFSLFFTQTDSLAVFLNIFQFLLFPLLLTAVAFYEVRSIPSRFWQAISLLAAFLTGIVLMLYLEVRSGTVETEAFGSFFSLLYALSIYKEPQKYYAKCTLVSAMLLLCSIGFKETFLPINFAVSILLVRRWSHFIKSFVLPLSIAVVIGVLFLFFLGYFYAYFSVYLPAMILRTVTDIPPMILSITPYPVFINLSKGFQEAPFLVVLIASLWSLFPIFKQEKNCKPLTILLCGLTLVLSFIMLIYVGITSVRLYALLTGMSVSYFNPFVPEWFAWLFFFPVLVYLYFWQYKQKLLWSTIVAIVVLYIVNFTAVVAGASGNHFSAAVPVYAVLALICVRYMSTTRSVLLGCIILSTILITAFSYRTQAQHLGYLQASLPKSHSQVERFDAMLDACKIERYYAFDHQPMYLSTHSFWGPLPIISNYTYLGEDHPLVQQTLENLVEKNQVFLLRSGTAINPFFVALLQKQFTQEFPECARSYLPLEGLELWFRQH
ncbi:hypothetical protein COU76_03805 [Candidatus Peregrinibacteria bacterium CG10_big_fil_rev_8_21_14_0_10_49_10]|nr:MAG: hypothetical protein COU76_03805 [Candidatus Peregrinibacteria bacterium CG10_big_fil_rev_8_21_14_0_10_49_10]